MSGGPITLQNVSPPGGGTLVAVTASDTTPGYLDDKLLAGAGLTRTIVGPGADEDYRVDVVANADGSIVVNADDVQVGVLATDVQHGARGGGTQHAVATASVAGFMSASDKTKLDGISGSLVPTTRTITAGLGLIGGGDLSADRTIDLVAGDSSLVVAANSVTVGVISDAQHGNRGGGSLHDLATTSTPGFIELATQAEVDTGTDADRAVTPATLASWSGLPANPVDASRTLTAGAGMTGGGDLSADRTFDVVANADGSIVVNANDLQVGVLATDAQHGNRGGGSLHAAATTTAQGFVELATQPEVDAGTDTTRAVTPATLAGFSGLIPTTRTITAGLGLQGGGDLSADRQIDIAATDASIVVSANSIAVGVISDTQHGQRGGGNLHDLATTDTPGFIELATQAEVDTGTDADRAVTPATLTNWSVGRRVQVTTNDLTPGFVDDKIDPGAGLTRTIVNPGGNEVFRLDVVANADGSIVVNADDVQVGVLATDAQHGTRGGGTLHAYATETVEGFIELATQAEVDTGTDTTRAITPATLTNWSGIATLPPAFVAASTGAPDAAKGVLLDGGGQLDYTFIDEAGGVAGGSFIIRDGSDATKDVEFITNYPTNNVFAITKPTGTSGAMRWWPNATTGQWIFGDPTSGAGVNSLYIDVDNAGPLYLNTLLGGGAGAPVFISSGSYVSPDTDLSSDLGQPGNRWDNVYAQFFHGDGTNLTGVVLTTRTLTAGAGLTGGGDLTADRTFDVVANVDGTIVVNADDIQVGTIQTGNVADDAVTYAKIQNVVADNVFLGNNSGAGSIVDELTGTEATALLDQFTTTLQGVVPGSGGGTTNFLRADGTWAAPPTSVFGTEQYAGILSTEDTVNSTTFVNKLVVSTPAGLPSGNYICHWSAVVGTEDNKKYEAQMLWDSTIYGRINVQQADGADGTIGDRESFSGHFTVGPVSGAHTMTLRIRGDNAGDDIYIGPAFISFYRVS